MSQAQAVQYEKLPKPNWVQHPSGVGKILATIVNYPLEDHACDWVESGAASTVKDACTTLYNNREKFAREGRGYFGATMNSHGFPIDVGCEAVLRTKDAHGTEHWTIYVIIAQGKITVEVEFKEGE